MRNTAVELFVLAVVVACLWQLGRLMPGLENAVVLTLQSNQALGR